MDDEPSKEQLIEAKKRFDEHLKNSTMSQIIKEYIDQPMCSGYSTFNLQLEEDTRERPSSPIGFKAPQDIIADLPQERITGDVLRGYGPRRGNLERLLRYWRPIMRKPGGFSRCRVILANHPELYPLENLCAWLHHETTGLWPNEGCHHPGMKNCRKKIRGVVNGSLITNDQFENRMQRLRRGTKNIESAELTDAESANIVASLKTFMIEEQTFCKFLNDDTNWVHEGMNSKGKWVSHSAH